MLCSSSYIGSFLKKPFVKFVCHSASYGLFLSNENFIWIQKIIYCRREICFTKVVNHIFSGLLALASQRVEFLCYELFGYEDALERAVKERGALPGIIESFIIIYVISKYSIVFFLI